MLSVNSRTIHRKLRLSLMTLGIQTRKPELAQNDLEVCLQYSCLKVIMKDSQELCTYHSAMKRSSLKAGDQEKPVFSARDPFDPFQIFV